MDKFPIPLAINHSIDYSLNKSISGCITEFSMAYLLIRGKETLKRF